MSKEIRSGDRVKLTPEYAGGSNETFIASQIDSERKRCWIGDLKTNSGWYAHFGQLIIVRRGRS